MINSVAFLIGSVLLIFMGLRPLIKALTKTQQAEEPVAALADETEEDPALFAAEGVEQLEAPEMEPSFGFEQQLDEDTENLFGQFKKSPQERLEELASENEEASAQVLRRWLDSEAA